MTPEPELEELSAYLDQQLPVAERRRVDAHLATCETCRRRLDAMRETVNAVRTLPMESPPRAFTVPSAEPRPALRWAPLAWSGGALAAAALVVIAGFALLHGAAPQGASSSALQYRGPRAETSFPAPREAADSSKVTGLAARASVGPAFAVPARRLSLQTSESSYAVTGTMVLLITVDSSPSALDPGRSLAQNGIRLALIRDGYSVDLPAPSLLTVSGQTIVASYRLADVPLSEPRAATYRLVVTWSLPNAPGTALVVEVPVTMAGP